VLHGWNDFRYMLIGWKKDSEQVVVWVEADTD
jgi:hypothetical protein